MDTQFEYRAICFALKGGKHFNECLEAKKLLSYRSVIISEHDVTEDTESCEYNELHYHGIVENNPNYRFDTDRIFIQFKNSLCDWFKSEKVKVPLNYLAYMHIPPRQIVYSNERNESDLRFMLASITPELISEVSNRKKDRVNAKKEGGQDIMIIKDYILKSNAQSEAELMNHYHMDPQFEQLYCKRTFSTNFKKALTFANQTVLDKDYLNLCRDFEDRNKECLSPYASANLMMKWFEFQKIDARTFCLELLDVMDKKQRKLNTFVMMGSPNSGKTFIAKSLAKACLFYGEISQGTAGYSFMYQDCVNKRVIILNEPFIDECMIEQLKIVMEGTGTFVHKKNCSDEYLRPTPVVVTANDSLWRQCPSAKEAIEARCRAVYDKLMRCPLLKKVKKDLHPRWLGIVLQRTAPSAPTNPISDSEDECLIGQDIDSVGRGPTSNKATQTEDQSTNSIEFAENTISACPGAPKKPIRSSLKRRLSKDYSETFSPELLRPNETSTNYQGENCCLGEETPISRPLKQRKVNLNLLSPQEKPSSPLETDKSDPWTINKMGDPSPWRQEKLTLLEEAEEEEEEEPEDAMFK